WGNVNANPSTPIISGMNTFTTGSPINFTSTLQSGETNTWTFNSNTFTGTSFTTTLGVGSYSVSVQNFNGSCASSSVSQSFTVKSRQTIAGISSLLSGYTYPVSNISLANVTASSGLPVSVVSYDPSVLSISGNFIYFLKAGVTTITASQAGNSQYFAAPALVYNVSVAQGASVISVTSSIPSVVTLIGAGTSITLSGVSSSGTPLQYTLSGGGSVFGNVITLSKAGTFTLTVSNLANDKYEASSLSFVINVVTVAGISNTTTPGPTNLSSFENSESVSFKVFPNPTTGTFSFVSEFANMEYIITNTEGNLVYKNTAIKGTNTIEVKLPKGIYFFNLGVQKQKLVVD
ncbi:MAG: T9SS type A sorting domain-containing protein, partial [Bacteroidota bacterium]|nr:T9SS type A sorting domain-containing protein [Bacteroidota bacterium]